MPATPITNTIIPPASPKGARNLGDAEAQSFREELQQQSLGQLAAILNPEATRSVPGAANALASAAGAPAADVAGAAAQQLVTQQRQQGIRDRGGDAASTSAQELQTRSSTANSTESSSHPESIDTGRLAKPDSSPNQLDTKQPSTDGHPARSTRQPSEAGPVSASGSNSQASPTSQATSAVGQMVAQPTAANQSRSAGSSERMLQAVAKIDVAQPTTPGNAKANSPSQTLAIERSTAQTDRGTALQRAKPEAQRSDPTAQVQRGLAQILRQRGGSLTMKLTPNELGEVKIALQMRNNRVDGTIDAKNILARDVLNQNIDALRASLEQRGVTVDRLEVRLQGAAESDQRAQNGAEAPRGNDGATADAGGDRSSGSAGSEERFAGGREGKPGTSQQDAERGASAPTRDEGQGRPIELAGGWLRLDTTA